MTGTSAEAGDDGHHDRPAYDHHLGRRESEYAGGCGHGAPVRAAREHQLLAALSYGGPEPLEIKDDLSRESLLSALQQSRTFLDRLPDGRVLASRPRKITAGEMKSSLQRFGEILASWTQPEKLAQMIRSLTSGTLSGWQESEAKSTDLSQLSASFRIDKGQAVTTDLNLVGPLVRVTGAGTIDLGQ